MAKNDIVEAALSPCTNPALIGHQAAEATLLHSWNSGKMPHAWLISGPTGIGKATLAYRFARFVLAQSGQADSLFNPTPTSIALPSDHPTFRRITAGSHGDLLVLEMKDGKEINVEEARKIAAFLRLTPSESAWRVVIVDSIDAMNRNAANAILKILEEPPANALIILISHLSGKVLPTIRSRCRQLRMYPPEKQAFSEILTSIQPDIGHKEMGTLYQLAKGSPGMALELYNKDGMEYYTAIINLLERLPRLDIPALHALGDGINGRGEEASWPVFAYMFHCFFHQLSLKAAGQMQEIHPSEGRIMEKLLEKSPLATWLELWEKIRQSFDDTARINLDRKQVVINAFTAIAAAF